LLPRVLVVFNSLGLVLGELLCLDSVALLLVGESGNDDLLSSTGSNVTGDFCCKKSKTKEKNNK